MPQVYFDVNTFSGKPVNISRSSLHHSRLMYETQNLLKMNLSAKEKQAAYRLIRKTEQIEFPKIEDSKQIKQTA